MQRVLIDVPTLRQRPADRDWLFQLEQQLRGTNLDVEFRFSSCKHLQQSAVAFLGGLSRLVESRGGTVKFRWDTLSPRVLRPLQQNRFAQIFGGPPGQSAGHTVPYREDQSQQNGNQIAGYLQQDWLGRGWMNISELLTAAIVSRVWEIYANAFEHGHSTVGVVTCGHHYENSRELSLTVVDFGDGVPANVRGYLQQQQIPAPDALRWAFARGNTTKRGGTRGGPAGLGLDLLKAFVKLNDGQLEFYSHEGQALITRTREAFQDLPIWFRGTMVTITFRCDDLRYQLASEIGPQRPLF